MSRTRPSSASSGSSTSMALKYLKATFNSPESHPEAKPMADFYTAIEEAIASVRSSIENADNDPAFKKAAEVFGKITGPCKQMETVSASDAAELMTNLLKEMKNIGPDSVMEVQGDASRMLAEKYAGLLQRLIDKAFWPVPSTPRLVGGLFGPSFATVYALNYDDGNKAGWENTIRILQERIASFDKSKSTANEQKEPEQVPARAIKL